ncbi:type II toxin-antitoxin system VapB family antitoxin [Novosphingobium sp. G106]|uniref:type II toxin-antitoxin system VapB family antitoxin n=1 Tax=Novosphingobium sp. G106 TaxID=2849500 RepID=UPI001C2D613C|nr:type II toxin-antitoxin system VapB family antitoxin [Novosphingobium sp. G106]MBV1686419.1 type II toxin-antitoxin system VapB family antitoxin [Novosphingobium sp. G106]
MARADQTQFNVRSAFARARAHELAKLTGMTATQIVEEALRGYVPPTAAAKVSGLVKRGPILVKPAGSKVISAAEAEAALDAARERGHGD